MTSLKFKQRLTYFKVIRNSSSVLITRDNNYFTFYFANLAFLRRPMATFAPGLNKVS